MSDVDLDEDLLALAGADVDELDSGESSPKKRSSSIKKSTTKKRKTRTEDDEDEHDGQDDDEDATEKNPYPLEGKYIDEEDKLRIEEMDEMEREETLYNRAQKMNEYQERLYLAQRAAREKNQVQQERSSRSKKVKESSRFKKSSKLSELKKQRDKKARRDAGDSYSEDEGPQGDEEDDDEYHVPDAEEEEADNDDYDLRDYYDEEDDYNPDGVEWGSTKKSEPVRQTIVDDINKIRIGRGPIAKYLYYPEFREVVKDCMARFNVGTGSDGRPSYRIVRIVSIERGRKPYKLEGSYVNMFAVCTNSDGQTKKVSMDFFSNSPFTQQEFDKYCQKSDYIPSVKKIEKKFKQLKEMAQRVLTSKEIKQVSESKQRLNRGYVGANAVMRRAELQTHLEVARQRNNIQEIQKIERELSKYDNARQKTKETNNSLSTLDRVNERNRKRNQDAIRKAEIIASERRRKEAIAVANGKVISNPFSRLKTNVRLYYQNIQKEEAEKHEQTVKDEKLKNVEKEKIQSKFFDKAKYRQVGKLDKVIRDSVDVELVV
ncbi:Rtf1 protein [Saccharomycopsis crataegensis]|uniref:Rtf1 protein n=1 Tax=Saccharomycopsis crataegensis TaxID=43959 RepID=A0AAV5QHB9_9ASCO|nr:Rtf1 protein [Saccharomycopsis crataegensis]